jgi:hypothetical protein
MKADVVVTEVHLETLIRAARVIGGDAGIGVNVWTEMKMSLDEHLFNNAQTIPSRPVDLPKSSAGSSPV